MLLWGRTNDRNNLRGAYWLLRLHPSCGRHLIAVRLSPTVQDLEALTQSLRIPTRVSFGLISHAPVYDGL